MTEFILDRGSPEAARQFNALDSFTQGYIEAMFFTETGTGDDGDLEHVTFADLAPESLAAIIADCAAWQKANGEDLDEALDQGRINGYDEAGAGRDYWFTRNGHGVGFWDRDALQGGIGEKLSKACGFSQIDMYVGDDGKVHAS